MSTSSTQRPAIVVIGDVMTDIVVRPQAAIATGSDTSASIAMRGGGSAANQACWLASFGLDVAFIGAVGRDPLGALHRDAFARAGVTAHLIVDPLRPTGTVVALIGQDGERTMLTERGANAALTPDAVPLDPFVLAGCLLLSGYTLVDEATRPAGLAALALARRRGMRIAVDPASAAPLAAAGPQQFLSWTRGADLFLPNLDEARVLTGKEQPEEAARALCATYGEVALKLGAEGALWACLGVAPIRLSAQALGEGDTSAAIDSTGAGDAFCAGFLSRWLRDAPPEEALAEGIRLGAEAAARIGARPPGADLLSDHVLPS